MEQMRVADSKAIQIVEHEPDPRLTDNALRVLGKRYLKKDDRGRVIETPKELFARVAWNLAQAERNSSFGVSMTRPRSSFLRYRFPSTRSALSVSLGSGSCSTIWIAFESATLICSME